MAGRRTSSTARKETSKQEARRVSRLTRRVHQRHLLQQPVVALGGLKLRQEAGAKLHTRGEREMAGLLEGRFGGSEGRFGGNSGASERRAQRRRSPPSPPRAHTPTRTWESPVNGLSGCTTSVLPGVRRSSGPCMTTTNLRVRRGGRGAGAGAAVSPAAAGPRRQRRHRQRRQPSLRLHTTARSAAGQERACRWWARGRCGCRGSRGPAGTL